MFVIFFGKWNYVLFPFLFIFPNFLYDYVLLLKWEEKKKITGQVIN